MSDAYSKFDEFIKSLELPPRENLSQSQIDALINAYNEFYPEKQVIHLTEIFQNLSFGDYNTANDTRQAAEKMLYEIIYGNPFSKDKLTGCLNVGAFNVDLARMIDEAQTKNSDLTLASLDIDNFMRVNSNFGHKVGDDVLKEIAKILLDIEAYHFAYRGAGDHFVLIFPAIEKEQVFLIMEETRKKIISAPECLRTSTTVSIGIATYPEDGGRDADIIRKADGALFRAKNAGRNRIALAKEEKLVTKTAHYTVEQLKQLEKLSNTTGVSEAALMREALDELLKKYSS